MIAHAASPRVVLAKIGLDGHDRGVKVVARGLRDAGFHVIYAGLWQPIEAVVQTALDEDADWLGISLLSGAHMTLVPPLMEQLRKTGLDHVGVLVGGIIPEKDVPKLLELGVRSVVGPGTTIAGNRRAARISRKSIESVEDLDPPLSRKGSPCAGPLADDRRRAGSRWTPCGTSWHRISKKVESPPSPAAAASARAA